MCQSISSETVELPPDINTSKEVRSVSLDRCLVPAIKALWAEGIDTLGCCCGHGAEPPSVIVGQEYTSTEVDEVARILRQVDPERDWNILQWRLTTVKVS